MQSDRDYYNKNDSNNNNNASSPQITTLRVTQPENAFLLKLPNAILQEIANYTSLHDQYNLSRVNKSRLHSFFKEPASQYVNYVNQFLTHVVRGEKQEAEAIITRDPRLLLVKIKVKDETGRTIYGTAYQISLGAKDRSLKPKKYEEMVEMLERYLKLWPDGEEKLAKQYAEQFHEGFEKQEEERRNNDSAALHKVFAAIKNATTKQAAKEAVKEFLVYLKKQTEVVITSGFHCNEKLFEEALKLNASDYYYFDFGGYDSFKNRAAAIGVLNGIEKYTFTANLTQAASVGFDKVLNEKKPLPRSKLPLCVTSFFDSNLSVSDFVYRFHGSGMGGGLDRARLVDSFQTYVEQKEQSYQAAKLRY